MTNNQTIDGVSRERVEAIAREMDRLGYGHHESHAESILYALLKVPAVERQDPYGFASVLIDNFKFSIENGKPLTFSKGDLLWLIEQLSKAQSESSALQSTIAQLQARIAELEKYNSELSWTVSPDRMGQ